MSYAEPPGFREIPGKYMGFIYQTILRFYFGREALHGLWTPALPPYYLDRGIKQSRFIRDFVYHAMHLSRKSSVPHCSNCLEDFFSRERFRLGTTDAGPIRNKDLFGFRVLPRKVQFVQSIPLA